jgi:hypothetical protein
MRHLTDIQGERLAAKIIIALAVIAIASFLSGCEVLSAYEKTVASRSVSVSGGYNDGDGKAVIGYKVEYR